MRFTHFTTEKKMSMHHPVIAAIILALLLTSQPAVQAVPYTWNTGSGDWTTDGNWDVAGDPDDVGDTAILGDVSGAYTTTLNAFRTIGGLTLSGTEPTLTINSQLTISGGTSTISGGTLNGLGTLRLERDGATAPTVDWTGTPMGGSLTIEVPYQKDNSPTINNSIGSFGIASGQTLQWTGFDGGASGGEDLTFLNGFDNAGMIRLGSEQPGAWYANMRMNITNGTLTNTTTGQIRMNPREPDNSLGTWNMRRILGNFDNQGLLTVLTAEGQIGDSAKTTDNSGTITLDSSIIAGGTNDDRAKLSVVGNTFTNSASGVINVNDGTLNVTTTTFDNMGTINFTDGTLAFGGHTIDTVVNWTGSDIVVPYTFRVNRNAEVTVNRTSTWNLLSGQTLEFQILGGSGQTGLTTDQDMTNSGVILMGQDQPGSNHINHFMRINSTNSRITNNSDGVIWMFPRIATELSSTWNSRRLEAELVNNGDFNILTHYGFLGKAGADHTNDGTIRLDDATLGATLLATPTLFVTGDSITNNAAGRIEGNGIVDVSGIASGLANDGTIAPGLSAGIMNITGDLTHSSTSQLEIELGGTTLGTVNDQLTEYDQLNISGTFAIDGELLITLIDGFASGGVSNLDTFTIATFSSATGTFSNLNEEGRVTISDFDIDGRTYSFLVNIGATDITLSNFEINPVPEPSSFLLLSLGVLGLLRRTRIRSKKG